MQNVITDNALETLICDIWSTLIHKNMDKPSLDLETKNSVNDDKHMSLSSTTSNGYEYVRDVDTSDIAQG